MANPTQKLPLSRVPHDSTIWFGILLAAVLFVVLLVLWKPASLALAAALLAAAVGGALLAAAVGAARSTWRRRPSRG